MIKYTLYRDYILKNLGDGGMVEIYKSTYSEAQSLYTEKAGNEGMAMSWVDSEITMGGAGMATQSEVDELNSRVSLTPIYPTYIMEKVRQRLDLESWDTSRDDEINSMSHKAVFEHCLIWEGIIGYDYMITEMIKDIYGVTLT